MKNDISLLLYQHYYKLSNRRVEITKKNGTVIGGEIIGYFKGDDYFISKWHIAVTACLEMDAFGYLNGVIVEQREIQSVKFFEDGSVLQCC